MRRVSSDGISLESFPSGKAERPGNSSMVWKPRCPETRSQEERRGNGERERGRDLSHVFENCPCVDTVGSLKSWLSLLSSQHTYWKEIGGLPHKEVWNAARFISVGSSRHFQGKGDRGPGESISAQQ